MKTTLFIITLLSTFLMADAQKYLTREAYLRFFGSTPIEDIEAVTNQASSVIDTETGDVVFQVLMNSFSFEKALMQEHFNENYVESEKYPKCTFKGKFQEDIDFAKPGEYDVTINGSMNLHGVEKQISTPAKLIIDKKGMKLSATFSINPEDYAIEIPGAVRNKIAEEMEVTVKAAYQPV
jgi:polyisoprenoid-binding protein YceI